MIRIICILFILCNIAAAVDKSELKKELARYHHNIGYSKAKKHLFGMLFLQYFEQTYFVTERYCNKSYDQSYGVGPMLNPSGIYLNCEHTWPKAKFNSKESYKLQESDLHHLFPVDAIANSTRGNLPLGEVLGEEICEGSKIGKDTVANVTSFEPPDHHKGDVARAMFYFSIRYGLNIDRTQEYFFRRWHQLDPVDSGELERNDMIETIQGNRNPFIDRSYLVDQISDF